MYTRIAWFSKIRLICSARKWKFPEGLNHTETRWQVHYIFSYNSLLHFFFFVFTLKSVTMHKEYTSAMRKITRREGHNKEVCSSTGSTLTDV